MSRMPSPRLLPLLARGAALALMAVQAAPSVLAQEDDAALAGEDDGDIAYARAGSSPAAVLTSGQSLSCDARAASGSGRWPCRFRTTSYNPANGRFIGEISWTSLGSVHEVRGVLNGNRLTFTETRAIRSGGAHLNVSYDLRLAATAASGSWRDPADDSRGSITIALPAGQAATVPAPSSGLANGAVRNCVARSADGARSWPCRLKFTRHDAASGRIAGELTWTGLNSVHVIEGQLRGARLTFTETRAIRAGGAHLNVTYDLQVGASGTTGSWRDPADNSRGSMSIALTR